MIRCVRLWVGDDGNSRFEEGTIELNTSERGDLESLACQAVEISFRQTESGGTYAWHKDPIPSFVITLCGTLQFETWTGATFEIRPGDVLLAQDNTGTGHRWKLIGGDAWKRAYVVYADGAQPQFISNPVPNGRVT